LNSSKKNIDKLKSDIDEKEKQLE